MRLTGYRNCSLSVGADLSKPEDPGYTDFGIRLPRRANSVAFWSPAVSKMNDSATNLDRLHDIVVPAPVPWWPPAPGWYAVFAAVLIMTSYLAYRVWKRWRSNAYRCEALRALENATTIYAISEILRRTALAAAPRCVVAAQVGSDWPAWLQERCSIAMPPSVSQQLTLGPYDSAIAADAVDDLKQYAAEWTRHHQPCPASVTK